MTSGGCEGGSDGGKGGGKGGGDGGGDLKRAPQSVQSVPYAQLAPVAPSPPSWQNLFLAYGPPGPDECLLHVSEQTMGGGVGGDEGGGEDGDGGEDGAEGEGGGGDGGGGEGEGGDDGEGGGGGGGGGGSEGGVGGGGEGGKYFRGPQSAQSVPSSHCAPSAPSCPSWQCVLLANCSPPLPKALRQVFSQIIGGGEGGLFTSLDPDRPRPEWKSACVEGGEGLSWVLSCGFELDFELWVIMISEGDHD